jgi:hypothetical protein
VRCYYVLVHGKLEWLVPSSDPEETQPAGFCCYRYVLAADGAAAKLQAFQRVEGNLKKNTGWLTSGRASLQLEADEVSEAAFNNLLTPDKRGHIFYNDDD